MSNHKKPAALVLGAALVGGIGLSGSAFAMNELAQGYQLGAQEAQEEAKASEGKCGEGRCGNMADEADKADGEGRCGGASDDDDDKADTEGKCGEGKCGGSA